MTMIYNTVAIIKLHISTLYFAIQYRTVLYKKYFTILYCIGQNCVVLYCIILHYTVLHCIVQ